MGKKKIIQKIFSGISLADLRYINYFRKIYFHRRVSFVHARRLRKPSGENPMDCSFVGLVGGTGRAKSIQNNRCVDGKR